MDSSLRSWNLEAQTTSSSPSSTTTTECGGKDTATPCFPLPSAPPPEGNKRSQIIGTLPPESARTTQDGQQEPKIVGVAGYQASQDSVGTPCDEPGRSSCASRSSIKERRPDDYVKALQEAGRYDLWAPLLHEALFLEAPSLLLGQIRFDVTSDDQRGSWLLPEELLTQQTRPVSEVGEDRQLFTNTPITEEEQQAIDQVLLQLLEAQEQEDAENTAQQRPDALLGIQPVWLEQLVLRYLYSCSFERQKTFDLLQSTLTFRTQQLPVLESEVYHELRNMGACYWHGRDHMMRPLLVVSLQRLQQLQREAAVEEKVTRLVVFCLEFFLRYLCVAGVVENWCILCDLNGTSIFDFPFPLLLRLMQLIQGSYRGRLYRFYILHAPRLFHFIAKPLVSSLPTTTAKKLRVFTNIDEWHQERRAQFAAHQLEKKYGGTAPDITEHWYPFRFFPGPFEPEGEAGQRGDRNAAVRWESEQALHAKVHPLVHTGASLHTSLIWSRRAERRSPPLRYAAWLRHLPDLHLAPATVDWAGGILRSRLQGHHDFLAQRLTDRQSETTADILNLHVGNGSAEGIPQSSFVHEAKPEKENKEADSQRTSELPALSDPVGETRQIPSTCSAHFPPQQNSSIDNVASASPVCSSPASLRRIPTTPCCGAADFTGKGLTAVDTLPSLPNPVEREAFEETKSPAELYVLCSSGARTSVEQVHPPLPHAVTTGRSATAAAEGPGDDCSSSVVAAEKYSNAWQSQSVPFSRTAPDATSGEACSVVVPETQTQFRYDDARSERLDLLEGFSQSTISKQMCGPPAPEVQPRQCSPLSIASCNEREDVRTNEQRKDDTLGTALTYLHRNKQNHRGFDLESDLRIASQGSLDPSSEALTQNRLSLRRLGGPIQQQQSRTELPSSSYFSDGNEFLSGVGTGEGIGVRKCSSSERRFKESSEAYFRESPTSRPSAADGVATMRAVSSSCGHRTQWPSLSVEGRRSLKGAQRKATVPAVQAGQQFGKSRQIRLREPNLTAQVLPPQPCSKVERHTQDPEVSGFLEERHTALSPSCKAQNPPSASRGHAIATHSAPPAISRAVSLHSRRERLLPEEASNRRSPAVLGHIETYGVSQMSTQAQSWGKDEGLSRVQAVALPVHNADSVEEKMQGEGRRSNHRTMQSEGGMACSGSGRPRRAAGRLLPLFFLAATAFNLTLCAGSRVSAEYVGLEAQFPQCWAAPQATRLSGLRPVGRNGGATVSASGGSLTACWCRRLLGFTSQRSGWQNRNAVGLTIGAQDFRHCWGLPEQHVAWLQRFYCPTSQTAQTNCLSCKGRTAKPFHSVASDLLSCVSRSEHSLSCDQSGAPLSAAPYSICMRRAVRVAAVKPKSRGSIDKRFKVTATGKFLYKRPGLQHHAHTKSSARRTRLRRVAALKPSQIKRLLGAIRVRR